ncbi:hypothetical protein MRB53_036078 [Persea americana]|uniref:Uncharacterized protein n=1 Tax=Persea americana TaxID=3435 RepID=A0ACC2K6K1_PERAE|nr:hypothetical protein MRB53_036078 [Persea americana]
MTNVLIFPTRNIRKHTPHTPAGCGEVDEEVAAGAAFLLLQNPTMERVGYDCGWASEISFCFCPKLQRSRTSVCNGLIGEEERGARSSALLQKQESENLAVRRKIREGNRASSQSAAGFPGFSMDLQN